MSIGNLRYEFVYLEHDGMVGFCFGHPFTGVRNTRDAAFLFLRCFNAGLMTIVINSAKRAVFRNTYVPLECLRRR